MTIYNTPEEYYFRLHHVRPRFKNDIESVLLFMASEISRFSKMNEQLFNENLNSAIKRYPGNNSAVEKTINNWRTEISSLFGLIKWDGDYREPSAIAKELANNEDLMQFFKLFLFKFQYPGGHLKSQEIAKMIEAGICFKPVKYIIEVLLTGMKNEDGHFGITKAEVTHCIFNDLRVTRDHIPPQQTYMLVSNNRQANFDYDCDGDVTRYAGDILDYMVIAGLLNRKANYKYYLNTSSAAEAIDTFIKDDSYYHDYDSFYGLTNEILPSDISPLRESWFNYVNNEIDKLEFSTDILSFVDDGSSDGEKTIEQKEKSEFINDLLLMIRTRMNSGEKVKTKVIGDAGESITIQHEQMRLIKLGYNDLAKLVKKIPEQFAVGYDISSFEGNGNMRRYIEVKTTVSYGKLHIYNFHMTPSEWSAAETNGDSYYVYRLSISKGDITLFVIKNPVKQYKKDETIEIIPRDGVDVRYSEKSGVYEELLA